MKGAICNVPVEIIDTTTSLPRIANNNGIVLVKLKRKLEYNGHVYFESVRPQFINDLLHYLKINNHLYLYLYLSIPIGIFLSILKIFQEIFCQSTSMMIMI